MPNVYKNLCVRASSWIVREHQKRYVLTFLWYNKLVLYRVGVDGCRQTWKKGVQKGKSRAGGGGGGGGGGELVSRFCLHPLHIYRIFNEQINKQTKKGSLNLCVFSLTTFLHIIIGSFYFLNLAIWAAFIWQKWKWYPSAYIVTTFTCSICPPDFLLWQ